MKGHVELYFEFHYACGCSENLKSFAYYDLEGFWSIIAQWYLRRRVVVGFASNIPVQQEAAVMRRACTPLHRSRVDAVSLHDTPSVAGRCSEPALHPIRRG